MTSENTIEVNEELWQLTPYNIYRADLPAKLAQEVKNYIQLLNQFLESDKPKTVSSVVITNYLDRRQQQNHPIYVNLYTFGSFRSYYSAITRLARVLTPLYLEIQILPIITPILNNEWKIIRREKRIVYRRITQHGIIGYSIGGRGEWT